MELSSWPAPVLICDNSLQNWQVIGSGGFGQIHKARHVEWCLDVAIKLLHHDDGSSSSLLREANLMRQGGSPYVLRILGVYQGHPPGTGLSTQLGLVMEFMEKGSLESLQDTISGPPPWPLAFRLAHQIALGMNFLHHLSPALLHLDLKPSNVLLDDSLRAKLTDFGLAKFSHSVSKVTKKDTGEDGGTISYMPPEAFNMSYKPSRASDIYSYGILLWSIVTGEQPYPHAASSMVRFRIPQGDRPSLAEVDQGQAAGLVELVDLMERCWDSRPQQRPSFLDCLTVTEKAYEKHKQRINYAVHEVLTKLDSESEERSLVSGVSTLSIHQPPASPKAKLSHHVKTGPSPTQETAGGLTLKQRDKASPKAELSHHVKTGPSPTQEMAGGLTLKQRDKECSASHQLMRTSWTDPVLSSTNRKPTPPPSFPNQDWKPTAFCRQNPIGPYQRQHSTPVPASHNLSGGIQISMSNVIGLQVGDNNYMSINTVDTSQRKRHRNPTAPSSVNLPATQPASQKDKL